MESLTEKESQAVDAIRKHQRETGISPTVREIAAAMGNSVSSAYGLIRAIAAKGHIRTHRYRTRGIELLESPERRIMTQVAKQLREIESPTRTQLRRMAEALEQ